MKVKQPQAFYNLQVTSSINNYILVDTGKQDDDEEIPQEVEEATPMTKAEEEMFKM